MTRGLGAFVLLVTFGCSSAPDTLSSALRPLQPPPVQKPTTIQRLALDGSVPRDNATPLASVRLIEIPKDATDTEVEQLLGDGTFYRLELDRLGNLGGTLVRFDDVGSAPVATRIPLVAPPGQEIRSEKAFGLGLRVEGSTQGVLMDRNRRGSVWWEEAGPNGRFIEFRIDGDHATMVPPGGPLDDPKKPIARRFASATGREVPYRFTTGAVDIGADVPRAFLGGSGFSVAVSRIGSEQTEAFLEAPAFDLPHVDVAEPAPGLLTVTIGYITGSDGHATQVTYDTKARRWQDHRPLVVFPAAQGVEVADVGAAGTLVVLGLPWNITEDDPETGLYWIRRDQPVRHLLLRVHQLKTVTLPDGFVALFQDESKEGQPRDEPKDMLVLRARGDHLALHRFRNPGPCWADTFAWLGGNRFVATFCSDQVVVFEVPPLIP